MLKISISLTGKTNPDQHEAASTERSLTIRKALGLENRPALALPQQDRQLRNAALTTSARVPGANTVDPGGAVLDHEKL